MKLKDLYSAINNIITECEACECPVVIEVEGGDCYTLNSATLKPNKVTILYSRDGSSFELAILEENLSSIRIGSNTDLKGVDEDYEPFTIYQDFEIPADL